MGAYVGIHLHRRRSVVVVLNEDGQRVSSRRWLTLFTLTAV